MHVKPQKGEVWFVQLDPTVEREQAKKRPCLVISANPFNNSKAELVIVIPITSTRRGLSTHVQINPPEGGVVNTSYLMCEQVRSVSVNRFAANSTGRVGAGTLNMIEQILTMLLDFNRMP